MNDSKRLYNKFTTLFWWALATLPMLFLIGQFLVFIFNKSFTPTAFNINNFFSDIQDVFNEMYNSDGILYNKLVDAFDNLLELFGLDSSNTYFVDFVSYTLSWFIFVHLLHIIVDTILILPCICQKFLRKVRD